MPTEERRNLRDMIISSTTLVPLAAVGVVIGATFWITSIYFNVQQNTSDIRRHDVILQQIQDQNSNLTERTTRIETKLDILLDKLQ